MSAFGHSSATRAMWTRARACRRQDRATGIRGLRRIERREPAALSRRPCSRAGHAGETLAHPRRARRGGSGFSGAASRAPLRMSPSSGPAPISGRLLAQAEVSVSQAGYNTVVDLLRTGVQIGSRALRGGQRDRTAPARRAAEVLEPRRNRLRGRSFALKPRRGHTRSRIAPAFQSASFAARWSAAERRDCRKPFPRRSRPAPKPRLVSPRSGARPRAGPRIPCPALVAGRRCGCAIHPALDRLLALAARAGAGHRPGGDPREDRGLAGGAPAN